MSLHRFFFFATIILLPTQLGFHLWPDWALVLGRRVDYLAPTIYITDITIFLTLAFWILYIQNFKFKFFNLKSNQNKKILKFRALDFRHLFLNFEFRISNYLQFVGFVVFVGLNIIFSTSPLVAFNKWLKVLEFVLFGFYIVKTKPPVSRTIWCLLFAVFYSSLIAIAQFFFQHSIGSLLWFLGERAFDINTPGIARISLQSLAFSHQISEALRPYATFPHPNVLGGFLAATLPLLIFFVRQGITNWQEYTNEILRYCVWIIISLGIAALFLTFSRSAWIAGMLGILIVSIYTFRKDRILLVGLPAIALATTGLVALIGLLFPYFQSLTPDSESVYVRNELAKVAISMWKTSPLFGIGLGNYLVNLPLYYPHKEIFFLQPVHSIYFLLLSEIGLIGLGTVTYLLFLSFKRMVNKHVFSIWHISFIIFLLLGVVDHYPLTLQQGQLLLTLFLFFSAF